MQVSPTNWEEKKATIDGVRRDLEDFWVQMLGNGTLKAGMRTGVMVIYKNGSVKEYGSYDNVIRGEDGTNITYMLQVWEGKRSSNTFGFTWEELMEAIRAKPALYREYQEIVAGKKKL